MKTSPPYTLVCLKAFGDLIISRWALQQAAIQGLELPRRLLGDHLADLDGALGEPVSSILIRHLEGGVPSAFDIRVKGAVAGAKSTLMLRRAVKDALRGEKTTLVFDKVGWRERIIAGKHRALPLPQTDNIYLAYSELLGIRPNVQRGTVQAGREQRHTSVGLFPGSRIKAKKIPAEVTAAIQEACRRAGMSLTVFTLDGETNDLPEKLDHAIVVSRSFAAMANAVQSVNRVISADSMPAHLAEYFGLPAFVVSRVHNPYWLPLSAYRQARSCVFSEATSQNPAIESFLSENFQ